MTPEQIAPYIPLISGVVCALIVGGFAVWNRKRGAVETKAPSVEELWAKQAEQSAELDIEIRLRRLLERLVDDLRRALAAVAVRARAGATELTPDEQRALDTPTPTSKDVT